MKSIKVYQTGQFPCSYDDLVYYSNKKKIILATVYSEKEAEKNKLKFGIKKAKGGIYDIVTDATEINNEVVRNALKKLEKRTNKKYRLISKRTAEDEIIKYANHLMSYSDRFYDKKSKSYDFSKAKTPYEKTLIIRSWIGELIYDAIVYKNPERLKSLDTIIGIETGDLIKQK